MEILYEGKIINIRDIIEIKHVFLQKLSNEFEKQLELLRNEEK